MFEFHVHASLSKYNKKAKVAKEKKYSNYEESWANRTRAGTAGFSFSDTWGLTPGLSDVELWRFLSPEFSFSFSRQKRCEMGKTEVAERPRDKNPSIFQDKGFSSENGEIHSTDFK